MKKSIFSLVKIVFVLIILIISTSLLKAQGPGGLIDGGGVGDTTMPVKKITLTANRVNDVVKIDWTTEGESQILTFTVEKSVTANAFTELYTVGAKNTQIASYSTSDVINNDTYYRIKATDIKGIVTYSDVKYVYSKGNAKFIAYPNPLIGNTLHIATSFLSAVKYKVSLYNDFGQNVFSNELNGTSNINDLKVGFLPAGHYNLTLSAGSKVVYNSALQIK